MATDGVQWVFLMIADRILDASGDAAREAERLGWPLASIGISYGATVVKDSKAREFAQAMEPFVGLAKPDATTSD